MRTLLNILWVIFGGGLVIFLEYLLGALILCLTIVGIPFGIQCFKIGLLGLWPFGKDIESARQGDGKAREQISELLRERVVRTAGHYASLTGMDREDLQQEMWVGMMMGLQQVDVTIGDPLYYLFLRGKWRLLEAIRRSDRERAESLESGANVPDRVMFEEEVCSRWMTASLEGRLRGPQRIRRGERTLGLPLGEMEQATDIARIVELSQATAIAVRHLTPVAGIELAADLLQRRERRVVQTAVVLADQAHRPGEVMHALGLLAGAFEEEAKGRLERLRFEQHA